MVCVKKTKSAAAAIATAASTIYQNYTGSGASPAATNAPAVLAADSSTASSASSTVSSANSGIKGFNYGAFFMDSTAKKQADFEYEFARAQALTSTTGWNSARLYTMGEYQALTDAGIV